jgi:autotransporter-associated beta strand protein
MTPMPPSEPRRADTGGARLRRPPRAARQLGIRQRSLGPRCRLGRATELVVILATGSALSLGGEAAAQSVWDGGGANADWNTANNWNPDGVPAAGTDPTVGGAGGANANPTISANTSAYGVTTISGGTVTANAILNSTSVVVSGTGTLTIGATGGVTGNLQLDATGTLTNNGTLTGALVINAGNATNAGAVTGTTTVNGGSLTLAAGSNLANGQTLTINGGTVNVNADETVGGLSGTGGTLAFSAGNGLTVNQSATTTFAGAIAGTTTLNDAYLVKDGTGSLTLGGSNTTTGGGRVHLLDGTLVLQGGNAIADNNVLETTSGTVDLQADETVGSLLGQTTGTIQLNANTLTVAGTPGAASAVTLGTIAGTGGVTVDATGFVQEFGTALTYTGATTVTAGTFQLGASNIIANASDVTVNGGTLALQGFSDTVDSVSLQSGSITGTGTLTSASDFDVRSGSVAAVLGGSVGLDKTTGGTVTLSGANTYTGTTTVSDGTLEVTGSIAGDVTVDGDGRLRIGNSGAIGGTITTTGSTVSYADGVNEASPLVISSADTDLEVLGADAAEQSGAISESGGSFGFEKVGTGTLTISGTNSHTGLTSVVAGTLNLANGAAITDTAGVATAAGATLGLLADETVGFVQGTGGTVALGANTLTINGDGDGATGETFSYGGAIDGTGGVTKTGTDTQELTGTNGFTGTLDVGGTAGGVAVTGAGTLATTAITTGGNATLTTDGGALNTNAAISNGGTLALVSGGDETVDSVNGAGAITLSSGSVLTLDAGASAIAGGISGAGGLTVTGTSVTTLSAANTYTGTTTLTAGTLNLDGGAAIVDTGAVVVNGGTLNVNGAETIGSLAGSGGSVELGANTLTINGDGDGSVSEVTSYAGAIDGSGGLTKSGTDIQTLTGTNGYTGATLVTGGTLRVTGGGTLASTDIETQGAGDTFQTDGGALSTTAAITNGGALILDGDESVAEVDGAGSIALNSGAVLTLNSGVSDITGDISGTGGLDIAGGTTNLSGSNTYEGDTTVSGGDLTLDGGSAIDDDGNVIVTAGTVDVRAAEEIGSLATSAGTTVTLTDDLTTGGNGTDTTVAGTIDGPGTLTKTGSGTMTVTGANDQGGTVVANGELAANGATFASNVEVDDADAGGTGGDAELSAAGATFNGDVLVTDGLFDASGAVTVAGLLTNDDRVQAEGSLDGDVQNNGTFEVTGALDGLGSTFANDGTLQVESGSYTNLGTVSNSDTIQITSQTLGATTISNLAAGNVILTDGIVAGALSNAGTVAVSGVSSLNGTLSGGGTIDLETSAGPDTLNLAGGAGSVGSHTFRLGYGDIGGGTLGGDRLVSVGGNAVAGGAVLDFDFVLDATFNLGDSVVVVEGQELADSQRTFTISGVGAGTTVFSVAGIGGDTLLVAETNPGIGGISSGVSLTQSLIGNIVNRPSSPFASGLAAEEGCSQGGYFRAVGGRASAEGTSDNGISVRNNTLEATYAGVQAGYDIGCNDGRFFNGWDGSAGFLLGFNTGETEQPIRLDTGGGALVLASTTFTDFDQSYGGFYVVGNRDRWTVDMQLRFETTEYRLSEAVAAGPALGLSTRPEFDADSVNFTGRVSYRYDLNDDGLAFVPTAGLSITRTGSSRVTFDAGETLDLEDYTSQVGFLGGTLARSRINEAGNAGSTLFVSGNFYQEFGGDRQSVFTPSGGGAVTEISSESIGGFAEASVGWNYVRILEDGPGGARQLNANVRADARFGSNVSEAYSLTAQIRLSF